MDFVYFLGRFHVLVLHLPIGIIVALCVLEFLSRKEQLPLSRGRVAVLWGATALSALVTVLLGFMHFAEGSFHGAVGRAASILRHGRRRGRDGRRAAARRQLCVELQAAVHAGVARAARARFDHGALRRQPHAWLDVSGRVRAAAAAFAGGLEPRRTITSVSTADPFADVVGPMLVERCASCHNEDKQEASSC